MDREKIIEGLENLKETIRTATQYTFTSGGICAMNMKRIDNALALLKEQTKTKVVFGRTKDGEFVTECGNCGTHLDKAYSNCPKCKKELDWNSNQT